MQAPRDRASSGHRGAIRHHHQGHLLPLSSQAAPERVGVCVFFVVAAHYSGGAGEDTELTSAGSPGTESINRGFWIGCKNLFTGCVLRGSVPVCLEEEHSHIHMTQEFHSQTTTEMHVYIHQKMDSRIFSSALFI